MRYRIVVASIASLALLVTAVAANAESKQTGGSIKIFVTPGKEQGAGSIVIAGAIGDYGKTTHVNKKGIGRVILKQGSFEVDLAAVVKLANHASPTLLDRTTCSYIFKVSGPVKIMDGAGLYKGITGHATITETFAVVNPRYGAGAKKGQCNLSNNANPLAQWGAVTGGGTVTYS